MLGNLTEDTWTYIASFLDVKSAVSLSQTCRTMHAVMSDPLLQEKLIPDPEPLYHEGKWNELGFWIHSVEHRIKRLKEFESKSVSLESMQNVIKNLTDARDVLDDQSSIQAMNQVISKHEKELACKKQQFKFAKEKYKRLDSKKRNVCALFENFPWGWKENNRTFPSISESKWKSCIETLQKFYGYSANYVEKWIQRTNVTLLFLKGKTVKALSMLFRMDRDGNFDFLIDLDPDWSDDVWSDATNKACQNGVRDFQRRVNVLDIKRNIVNAKKGKSCPNVCAVLLKVFGCVTNESLDLFGIEENFRLQRFSMSSLSELLCKRKNADDISYIIENGNAEDIREIYAHIDLETMIQLRPSHAKIELMIKRRRINTEFVRAFCSAIEILDLNWVEMFEKYQELYKRLTICTCACGVVPQETMQMFISKITTNVTKHNVFDIFKTIVETQTMDPLEFLAGVNVTGKEFESVLCYVHPKHFQALATLAMMTGNRNCVRGLIRLNYFPSPQDYETVEQLCTRDKRVFLNMFKKCEENIIF